jgi:hypothetical protein
MTRTSVVGIAFLTFTLSAAAAFAQEAKPIKVQLSLEVSGAKLSQPTPEGPVAELTAKVKVSNQGEEMIVLSQGGMQFFLFDGKDQLVEVKRAHAGLMDAAPLQPKETGEREVKLVVPQGAKLSAETPYRLVVVGYETAAMKSFRFKK